MEDRIRQDRAKQAEQKKTAKERAEKDGQELRQKDPKHMLSGIVRKEVAVQLEIRIGQDMPDASSREQESEGDYLERCVKAIAKPTKQRVRQKQKTRQRSKERGSLESRRKAKTEEIR